jgi:glycosyltransferase involved in cell wall biosynthesis
MTETAILLATYNGARFLPVQLDSLLAQTYQDYVVVARDDGSQDTTSDLLFNFKKQREGRCLIISDRDRDLGACRNFGRLLRLALAHDSELKYFAFCDQDDWWAPDKLRAMISQLCALRQENPDLPLLVHCDLEIVDEELRPIASSYWRHQKVDPAQHQLRSLLFRNSTVGCAMIINRKLAEIVLPIPAEAIMHDWWITLVAAITGKIGVAPRRFVKYRQHKGNTLGAKSRGLKRFLSLEHWRTRILNTKEFSASRSFEQADALRERFASNLNPEDASHLELIAGFKEFSYTKKCLRVLRSGMFPRDPIRFVGMLVKL